MTLAGWVVMILSIGGMSALLIICLSLLLRAKPERLHSPVDIHPDEHDPP